MGNSLQTTGTALVMNPTAFKLVNQIRENMTLERLCSCFNVYMEDYYPREDLTQEEYDNVFCQMLNNTSPLFDVLEDRGTRTINIYQLLIALVVFESHAEFDEKVRLIFKAFDIDGSGSLDKSECGKFLISGITGLAKMVGLTAPSRIGIGEFTHA